MLTTNQAFFLGLLIVIGFMVTIYYMVEMLVKVTEIEHYPLWLTTLLLCFLSLVAVSGSLVNYIARMGHR